MRADLAQADLYLQLLGPRSGRYPSDIPEGYPAAQIDAAKAAGKNLLLWRHPELDPDKVSDPRQRALLTDANVIACGLESFKAEARRRLEARPTEKARDTKRSALVFINSTESDYDVARIVQQEFSKRNLPTILPPLYAGTCGAGAAGPDREHQGLRCARHPLRGTVRLRRGCAAKYDFSARSRLARAPRWSRFSSDLRRASPRMSACSCPTCALDQLPG